MKVCAVLAMNESKDIMGTYGLLRCAMLCSTWVMLNTLTRRLAKMPDEMRTKMEYLAPHPPR